MSTAAAVFSVAALANPPDPNTVGFDTVSNIALNGLSSTVITVTPGTDVKISASYSDSHSGYCPGCIDQLEVAFAGEGTPTPTVPSDPNAGGTFTGGGCIEVDGSTGSSGSGTADLGAAPATPGTYDVYANADFGYWCGQDWSASDAGYTVIAQVVVLPPPTVSITRPANDATYGQGASVSADYSCSEGTGGPGLNLANGCAGTVANGSALDTASLGGHSFTVTATSQDGESTSRTVNYTVAATPTVTITTPADGATYTEGQSVAADYSCSDGTDGPGLVVGSGCAGTVANGSAVDTGSPGSHSFAVIATSQDGQTDTKTIHYTVAAAPTASIGTPAGGGTYSVGQTVSTSFSCTEGVGGPGVTSCDDNNGTNTTTGGAGTLFTGSPGHYTYTVTATSGDTQTATESITYTVADPPSAAIASPAGGGTYTVGQSVPTSFSCTDSTDGPGVTSCDDSNGTNTTTGGAGTLFTGSPGHYTYTVTATSGDTQTATKSITYSVADPPSATIASPASGGTYAVGQTVPTSFSCTDSTDGPGITSCDDSNGENTSTGGAGTLNTAASGHYTYTVTATSGDGQTATRSITYSVADPPSATIASPAGGGTYTVGQSVPTSFSCTDSTDGPGITSCDDSNGTNTTTGGAGTLFTGSPGHYTYTVTATSGDGQTATKSITYSVADPPSATIASPASGGTYAVGQTVSTSFSCTDSTDGPGITSCDDTNGTNTSTGGAGTLFTGSPGHYTYTVTATSGDGQTATRSITYTVADPPSATIASPAGGGTYSVGQTVPTSFSCTDSTDGPGITSCDDNNGTNTSTGGAGTLFTGSPGHYTYTVTATSGDTQTATKSITYTVAAPPTATINSPGDGQTYDLNQSVATSFSCTEGADGPGLTSCTDSHGAGAVSSGTGTLNTASAGTGFAYSVTVQSSDGQSATTTIHYSVVYVPPVNTAPPVISGTVQQGRQLSATTGTWTGDPAPTYAYQWQQCDAAGSNCTNITGATDSDYVPSSSDVGHTLSVTVTATNPAASVPASSQPTTSTVLIAAPANTSPPTVTGIPQQGDTLSANIGAWANAPAGSTTYSYQWWRCGSSGCAAVAGAGAASYLLGAGDVGATLQVYVTATNAGGSSQARSEPTAVIAEIGAPANTSPPSISGTPQQGQTLSALDGQWTNSPSGFAYQWLQCDATGANCTPISGATNGSYVPASTDVGHTLRVTVTASNGTGGTPATTGQSAAIEIAAPVNTVLPLIAGTPVQGQPLSTSNGSWQNSPTAYAYQWLQCDASGNSCTPILNATGSSYTPVAGDAGHTLRVTVSATNAFTTVAATSAQTEVLISQQVNSIVAALPPPVLGSSTNLNPVTGTILIRLPGSKTFVPVPVGTNVPLGSTVDATHGTVSITVQLPDGMTQTGQFYDGEFVLTQAPDGTTIPILTGGSFAGCPAVLTAGHGKLAHTATTKKKPTTVVRQLWGNAHGNYTTKGRYGSASVSGTIWLVQDRCDGTYIAVTKDNVIVVSYAHPNKKINITQGHHILIPPPAP